ncbi:MAG: hypothetical protein RLZZ373_1556 [Pseudomonadota bacterium]
MNVETARQQQGALEIKAWKLHCILARSDRARDIFCRGPGAGAVRGIQAPLRDLAMSWSVSASARTWPSGSGVLSPPASDGEV